MLDYFSTTTGKYPLHISENCPKTTYPNIVYFILSNGSVKCNGCSCANCQLEGLCTSITGLELFKKLDPKFCETNPEFFI